MSSVAVRRAFHGSPSNHSILLDDLVCDGTEDNLLMCPCDNEMETHCTLGRSDCSHQEDAGVRCNGMVVCKELLAGLSLIVYSALALCTFMFLHLTDSC